MFFPLGFGNWPRVFPLAILTIAAICLAWSFQHFPELGEFEKQSKASVEKFEGAHLESLQRIFKDSCAAKFKSAASECETVADAMKVDGFKLPTEVNQKILSSLGYQNYKSFVSYINEFYDSKPKAWPKSARKHALYGDYAKNYALLDQERKKLAQKYKLSSYDNKSPLSFLKAGFTHADYMHLFGNLLFLIIFGVWTNQRMGTAWTFGVFSVGSFAGLYAQVFANNDIYVLGASAGISALMGAFFAFFYAAEFHFLFTFGFVYFKRLSIPLYWVFPAFYVAADFTAVLGRENSGVAHLAHLVGFVVGLGFGFLHKKLHPVQSGHLFSAESDLLSRLKQASNPSAVWENYCDLMKWNLQNSEASVQFLEKASLLGLSLKNDKELKLCQKYVSQYILRCFRKSDVRSILNSLEVFPVNFSLAEIIRDVPLRQVLQVADYAAGQGYYNAALGLYQSAFPKLTHPAQAQAVNNSISLILQKQQANQLQVSGG